jgi:hypothetical protein
MKKFPEINWSGFVKKSIEEYFTVEKILGSMKQLLK